MALTPATARQVPEHSIMDIFGKQAYLGNQFVLNTGIVSLGDTNEHPLLYLANAGTNTAGLFNYIRKFNSGAAAGNVIFRVYWNPTTVTSGSTGTPVQMRIKNANTSVATALVSPAAVSNGTLAMIYAVGFQYQYQPDALLIADPGSSLMVTAQAVGSATTAIAELVWWEI